MARKIWNEQPQAPASVAQQPRMLTAGPDIERAKALAAANRQNIQTAKPTGRDNLSGPGYVIQNISEPLQHAAKSLAAKEKAAELRKYYEKIGLTPEEAAVAASGDKITLQSIMQRRQADANFEREKDYNSQREKVAHERAKELVKLRNQHKSPTKPKVVTQDQPDGSQKLFEITTDPETGKTRAVELNPQDERVAAAGAPEVAAAGAPEKEVARDGQDPYDPNNPYAGRKDPEGMNLARLYKDRAKHFAKMEALAPKEREAGRIALTGTINDFDEAIRNLQVIGRATIDVKPDSEKTAWDMLPDAATGTLGAIGRAVPLWQNKAKNMQKALNNVQSVLKFERLAALKNGSATGASGLGQVTKNEFNALAEAWGSFNLDISDPKQYQDAYYALLSRMKSARDNAAKDLAVIDAVEGVGTEPKRQETQKAGGILYPPGFEPVE